MKQNNKRSLEQLEQYACDIVAGWDIDTLIETAQRSQIEYMQSLSDAELTNYLIALNITL